jgi:CheY-like chemotaxis protein
MKILIVDDELLVRKSLGRACRARGHEVIEANDGQEGLVRWREVQPDLVFLDVLMPGMSGPEVLQAIRQESIEKGTCSSRRARVILISAYSGEHNFETAHQIGADLFVPKPFEDIFEIVNKAENLMAGH